MRVLFSVLLFVLTALAYQITCPGVDGINWNSTGPNYVEWVSVDTDPSTFAMFLTNENDGSNSQLLNAVVNGSLDITVANPPSGGWTPGIGFRVNFAQDSSHPDSLLAQSDPFNITADSSAQSSTTQSNTASGTTQTGTGTATASATSTGTNAAPLRADAPAGFMAAVAAVTALFATLF